MVFNSLIVLSVAHLSADAWQILACIPDRLSSHQLLDLVYCFPLQQLGRFALCLGNFLCLPPPDSYYTYYYSSDSDDSSTTVDYDEYSYNSHSD